MADIELVIKISEEMYAQIIDKNGIDTMLIPYKDIIKNGTPLPKGHGVDVINKIRAEIENIDLLAEYTRGDIKRMALAVIDKYKGESEGE